MDYAKTQTLRLRVRRGPGPARKKEEVTPVVEGRRKMYRCAVVAKQ